MKRKIIALVLAIALVVGALPLTVFAGDIAVPDISSIIDEIEHPVVPDISDFIDEIELPVLPYIQQCPSKPYVDTPPLANWAHEGIDYCISKGLMNGVGDDKFNPNGMVTRAQLVTILYRMAGSPYVRFRNAFTDIPDGTWYSAAIVWADSKGYVNGVGNGRFNPFGNITREQLITILFRYAGRPYWEEHGMEPELHFADFGDISSYAIDGVRWGIASNIMRGVAHPGEEYEYLDPKAHATRAQIATIIMRFEGGSYTCVGK